MSFSLGRAAARTLGAGIATGLMACAVGAVAQTAAAQQGGVTIEQKVSYLGSPNNIRITNGNVELILATDYGPRIMRYAFVGSGDDGNVFATIPGVTLHTDLGDWYIRGGHRLWHAPEGIPRSYVPDNTPIDAVTDGNTIKLIEPVEKPTGIQKEIDVTLDPSGSHVTVVHHLTNKGLFAVDMACWAMSAMNKGGTAIFPQEPFVSHDTKIDAVRPMVLWSYTDLTDPRLTFGKRFFTLRQDPNVTDPNKIGILNREGWAAYYHNGSLFVKRFSFDAKATYPDYDCNNESFTNNVFLELETLGPMRHVEPGQTITWTENWWLFPKVDLGTGEAGIAAAMEPLLAQTQAATTQ
ncbi:MAG: hypothetical protein KGJ62_08490 [Armatimonadetes bacterium]|nr:hypothetical protein [Armatimonadota bacterium]MDE2205071.1 hypothetical protein [Armatimonadota bacterium]